MKNAMKKLLSLALVAMLLVSVVPMGAMADEWLPDNSGDGSNAPAGVNLDEPSALNNVEDPSAGNGDVNGVFKAADDAGKAVTTNKSVNYTVYKPDGSVLAGTAHNQEDTKTLMEVLRGITVVPEGYDVKFVLDGKEAAEAEPLSNSTQDVPELKVTIAKKKFYITIKLDGVTEKKRQLEAGTVLTLNEKTLAEFDAALKVTEGKELESFVIGDRTYAVGSTYTVTQGATITAFQKVKGTDGGNNPTTPTEKQITLQIKFGSNSNVSKTFTKTPDNGTATVSNMLTDWYDQSWNDNFNCTKAWSKQQQKDIGVNGTAKAGDTVTVILETKGSKPTDPTKPTTPVAAYIDVIVNVDGATKVNTSVKAKSASIDQLLKSLVGDNWASVYKFDYWSEEGQPYKYANVNSVVAAGKRITINLVGGTSKHNTNKVMLHVFLNGNTSAVYASYNITGDLAKDYKVTYGEVEDYLLKKYKAKTDAGIDLDGLYYVTGNWVGNYFQDNKSKTIDDLDWELEKGYVHINVMLNNATAKTSSNADTSNPKTGDDIYMTVTVMGLSAAALCAVYYISKKRAVR